MRQKRFNTQGFTFVEVIITLGIVAILLALTWATVSFMLIKSNEQIVRTRAHFLTMEGIEIVKQIRQTAVNRNRESGFKNEVGKKSGNYIITQQNDAFELLQGENERIEMQEDPFIDYCRTIEISEDSEVLKKITSTVSWGDSECALPENRVRYSTYLADLKK